VSRAFRGEESGKKTPHEAGEQKQCSVEPLYVNVKQLLEHSHKARENSNDEGKNQGRSVVLKVMLW